MLKKIILTNLFACLSLVASAQVLQSDSDGIFPEAVERNYDELLTKWYKDVKYANSCESMNDDPVFVSDSIYIQRLYSLPTEMELAYNPIVKELIERYAGRMRKQVSYMLGEGQFYFPIFEDALSREGMPLELKYLPVIESALNPVARSRAGAVGLWQFMPGTATGLDLEINSLVDERRDTRKATDAAVKYLKGMYQTYGDWSLAIAAYNCGPGNVNKAIRKAGGLTDFWAIYPYLPRETRGYVPIFTAATYIMSYHKEHNICPMNFNRAGAIDTVMVNKHIHFQQIAEVLNMPIEDIRAYNPQYKDDIIPGEYKKYSLKLPIDKLTAFIDNEDKIVAHRSSELLTQRRVAGPAGISNNSSTVTHKVKKGETLSRIAGNYGVTTAQIKSWNGLKSNSVSTGKRLKIYKNVPAAAPAKTEPEAAEQQLASTDTKINTVTSTTTKIETVTTTTNYKIRKGDNWSSIAKKQGVTVAQLQKWNGNSKKLTAGKSLKIQQTKQVEVIVAVVDTIKRLKEPELMVVELDSTYVGDVLDDYLNKMDNSISSLPVIKMSVPGDSDARNRNKLDETTAIYHKVRIGETITQIASRYNVTKKDVMSWNSLSSNMPKVGQRLLIHIPEKDKKI